VPSDLKMGWKDEMRSTDPQHKAAEQNIKKKEDEERADEAQLAEGFVMTGDAVEQRKPNPSQAALLETSLKGVFAVGDVRSGNVKRVASAVGEGSVVIHLVHNFLQRLMEQSLSR